MAVRLATLFRGRFVPRIGGLGAMLIVFHCGLHISSLNPALDLVDIVRSVFGGRCPPWARHGDAYHELEIAEDAWVLGYLWASNFIRTVDRSIHSSKMIFGWVEATRRVATLETGGRTEKERTTLWDSEKRKADLTTCLSWVYI